MTARQIASVPIVMERARRCLERWRSTRRSRRSPIPAALWATAVAVARQHGLYATSRTLRLDYAVLKKRMHAADDRAGASASPTFVELRPWPSPTSACDCVIELETPRGGRMRVQVKGVAMPDLVALSRVAWSGEA